MRTFPLRWNAPRGSRLVGVACMLVLAALLGLKAAGLAGAAGLNFQVNSTADALDASVGDGVCRTSAGTCTLRAAIQEANAIPGADVIHVPGGTYELAIPPLNQNDITTGDLDITGSLAINGVGPSTIIDGGTPPAGAPPQVHGLDRLFEVLADGGTVTFSSLTLRDGYAAEWGGAILNNSSAAVAVTASMLTGNVAGKTGGAIDNHVGGVVDVRDATVSGNYAPESGSALNNNRDGTMTLTNSTVSANSAAAVGLDEALVGAGAISNNAELDARGTITVTASQISDNRAGGGRSGAGLSNDGAGTVTVDRVTFSKNRTAANGGAIFNGTGDVTVTRSTFSENAGKDGGALASSGGVVAVLDSAFSKNNAEALGGAILNSNLGGVTIENSTFSENSALTGGGFSNEGTGLVTVESTTFTKNTAVLSAVLASGEGGGMHSNSGGQVVITGGAFTANTARSGGGLSNEGGGQVAITGTRFSANHAEEAGGGILIQSGAVRMVEIDVIGNVSSSTLEGGGGISYHGDKTVAVGETAAIENSRIRDNKSNGDGGGIDSRGDGPLGITTTAITGNTAAVGGGIHHVGDAPLLVTRSTLSGNFAENGGAVFSDGDGEATIENTTVSGNRAGQFGGGLLVSSRLATRNSTVANNSAASGGGINNGGGDLIGDGSVYLANTIIAGNQAGGNCAGTITSRGGNVEGANTCQLRELSDQPGTDPRLGPLADNGGPTQTHALLAGSPAQERAVCTEVDPCPPVDQRGLERPRFAGSDVGAYESELTPGGGGAQQCAGLTERPVPSDFDSWVSQAAPSANFATDATLEVKSQSSSNERTLVHFTLPPVPPGCKLVAARLRLYASSATDGRTLEARRVTSDWSELDVTWGNQPASAGPAAVTQSGLDIREWDVLAQTRDMYTFGDHGFMIRDGVENGSGAQSFHSREKGTDRPPELVLVFDDPDSPPPPGSCPKTPQIFSADRDSWVSESSPSNNFGTDSTLKVKSQGGSDARTLIRFALPVLPAGCTTVASAALRLEAASAKEGHTLEALQVTSNWSETGVTWSNQPASTGPAAITPSAQGRLEWAVTAQVLGMYTSANHGFLIRDDAENGVGDEQTLNSRDKVSDGPPELVMVFDDSTPETTIDSGPVSPTDSTDATFAFSSDRADATLECSLDGATFRACASPYAVQALGEGGHRLEVRSTRRVRAVDPTPATYEWTVDLTAPETVIDSGPADPTNATAASFAFSAGEAASFECRLDGGEFGPCESPAGYERLAEGRHSFEVRATDLAGNMDASPALAAWTIDVTAPETAIDSGPVDPSNSSSAEFAFSANEQATFECSLDGAPFAPCSRAQTYEGLGEGGHVVEVRAIDRAGNVDGSAVAFGWTIDLTVPETSIDGGPADRTNSTSASFAFSASEEASFECRLDGGAFATCGSPQSYEGLSEGAHTFDVRAIDRAGNVDSTPARAVWTVDLTPPEASIDEQPGDPTSSVSARFAFSADEAASFECRLDGGAFAACASPASYEGLAEGRHSFEVRATDTAGNLEPIAARAEWTVDLTPPETAIDSGPRDPSNSSSAEFAFSADEEATFACSLDGAPFASCPAAYDAIAEGAHSLQVRAVDRAGNVDPEPAVYRWVVDLTQPETSIDGRPADRTNSTSASFAFSAGEEASFECRLDGGAFATCGSPQSYEGLGEGAHTFDVRAIDRAGNVDSTPARAIWTVDLTPPETSIDDQPSDPTNSSSAKFAFSAHEQATFACSLDGAPSAACSSPRSYDGLGEGRHTFEVRAVDAVGNVEATPASHAWTVDQTAPQTTISGGPVDPTNSTAARFVFSSDEPSSGFACSLDGGAFAACGSPAEYTVIEPGTHTFRVRATDAAGNSDPSPASHTWTIDVTPPDTQIDAQPADPTNATAASFSFSSGEPGPTFECRLDGATFAGCSSPQLYAGLAEGRHTFDVRATDAAGNVDASPARYSWTIDITPPETTIDSAPNDPSSSTTATFMFSAGETGSTYECSLDGAPFAPCTSPRDYGALAVGRHEFRVRATDAAANTDGSPATHSWTIEPPPDTTAPETTIDSAPPALTASTTASLSFSSSKPSSTFECSLDGAAFAACVSPRQYTGLASGSHQFRVRATDGAGNVDQSPAAYSWTIDNAAPDTTISAGPPVVTASRSASFSFSSSEADSAFRCSLDGGAFVTCTSPQSYASLADGTHQFRVRATDAAGNVDATPATASWTIDTVAPETTISAGPPAATASTSASFSFSASESGSTFECSLDAAAFVTCLSPRQYTGLASGTHQFRVRATDGVGNADTTPAQYGWTIDTVAPETTIDAAPPATTTSTSASFSFSSSESGSAFECSLDGSAFAACTSPRQYTALATGSHHFQVRARDAVGNLDASPAAYSWTITAPTSTCPAPTTLGAAADAWIDENSSSTNKGGDSILKVRSKGPRDNFRALVRFTLPALPQGCYVETATLRLYAASATSGRSLQALRLSAGWAENTVSWGNQPQTTGLAVTAASGLGYRDWNVTSQMQAMFDENANHGFLIRDAVEGADAEQQFHSREKGEHPPQLAVRFAAGG